MRPWTESWLIQTRDSMVIDSRTEVWSLPNSPYMDLRQSFGPTTGISWQRILLLWPRWRLSWTLLDC